MTIRESLESVLYQALKAAVEAGELPLNEIPQPSLERPREEGHGDWACTIAMRLAKAAHMNPRAIAQVIVDHLPANNLVESFEIAGPGFINHRTSASGKRKIPSSAVPEANSVSLSNCSIPFSLACPFSFLYAAADIKMSGSVDKPEKRWYNFKSKMKRYGGDAA